MATSLLSVPDEILLKIFKFFPIEDCCILSRVCIRFWHLALIGIKEFEGFGVHGHRLAHNVLSRIENHLKKLSLYEVKINCSTLFSSLLNCTQVTSLSLVYENVECRNWSILIQKLGCQLNELVLLGPNTRPDDFCAKYLMNHLSAERLKRLTITLNKSETFQLYCERFTKLEFFDVITYQKPQFKLFKYVRNLKILHITIKVPIDNLDWLKGKESKPCFNFFSVDYSLIQ